MCELCGMFKLITSRLFQYDNGEQVLLAVCPRCVNIHNRCALISDNPINAGVTADLNDINNVKG